MKEFKYIRATATGNLARFMDFVACVVGERERGLPHPPPPRGSLHHPGRRSLTLPSFSPFSQLRVHDRQHPRPGQGRDVLAGASRAAPLPTAPPPPFPSRPPPHSHPHSTPTPTPFPQSVDMEAVVENCHPLGLLEPAVMKSILAFEDLAEDFHALYRTILVDTPVGKYFTMFLQETADEKSAMDPDSVKSTFTEIPITLVENSIKKFYLEDFFYFCREEIGGETGVVMGELLATRADMLAINIAYNSLNTELRGPGGRASRQELFPAFGHLYPGGAELLAGAEDEEAMRRALQKSVPGYVPLWDSAPVDGRGVRDLSDAFFRYTVKQLELAFDGQFHYSPFYAYAKLKEQECKNIAWIATCMEHGVYSEVDRIIPVFSRVVLKRG